MLAQRTCTSSSRVTCVTLRLSTLRYAPLHRPFEALPSRSTVTFSTSTCSTAHMSGMATLQSPQAQSPGHQNTMGINIRCSAPRMWAVGGTPIRKKCKAHPSQVDGALWPGQCAGDRPDGRCCSGRPLHTRAQSLRSARAGQRQRMQPAATSCPQTTAARPAPGAHQTCAPPACLMDAAAKSTQRPLQSRANHSMITARDAALLQHNQAAPAYRRVPSSEPNCRAFSRRLSTRFSSRLHPSCTNSSFRTAGRKPTGRSVRVWRAGNGMGSRSPQNATALAYCTQASRSARRSCGHQCCS